MSPGLEKLRREIARRSLDCGLNPPPDNIITTCGGTEALSLCFHAAAKPGNVVAVESSAYFGVLQRILRQTLMRNLCHALQQGGEETQAQQRMDLIPKEPAQM